MPVSRREAALAACFAALETALAGSGATVARNRSAPVTAATTVVQRDGGMDLDGAFFGEDRYRCRVTIELYLTSRAGTAALSADLADYHAKIVKGLQADLTLGGAADDIEQVDVDDPDQGFSAARKPEAAQEIGFVIEFTTKENDPDTPPTT
jgi:hypothetical protein